MTRYRRSEVKATGSTCLATDDWFPQFNVSAEYHLNSLSESLDSVHPDWFWDGAKSGNAGGPCDIWSRRYTDIQPAVISEKIGREGWYGSYVPESYYDYGGTRGSWTGDLPIAGVLSDIDLLIKGATGISRATPTNPSFGLSRAIGEIRKDGLPALVGMQTIREKSRYLSNSGSEYLNVEFAWKPLVSDLKGLAKAVKGSNKVLAQYRKDSDKKIKRRYSFPDRVTSRTGVGGDVFFYPNQPFSRMWPGTQTITSHAETSFSGAFRYHVPIGDDLPSKMMVWESEANKLLGLRLTPKLVWDLAPWTWAVDWFTNFGDVINNISRLGSDGLVLQYGYITDHFFAASQVTAWTDTATGRHTASMTTEDKYLKRRSAHWFGFGFDNSALSASQDAVVVALGLSHGHR